MKTCNAFCIILLCISVRVFSQEENTTTEKAIHFPDKIFAVLDRKAASLNQQIDKHTERYLAKISRQEEKLRKKIAAKNPALANELYQGTFEKYNQLQQAPEHIPKYASVYAGHLDSLSTSLQFLQKNNIANLAGNASMQKVLNQYGDLQSKLNSTEQIKRYLAQRRELLQEKLKSLGLTKELDKFRKQEALFHSQIEEYKNILNEQSKLESILLTLAQKIPAWKNFFANNSILGSLFALPVSGTPQGVPPGLQTREMVNQVLTGRFGSMNAATQAFQQSMPAVEGQLQQFKDKISRFASGTHGNGPVGSDMPDYQVNPQHSRKFLKRLELGTTIQSQKSGTFLPVNTLLGLSIGYKISNKQTVGIGISERIGWGSGWKNIKISQQGISIKSFLDIKLKGSIWITGGYEKNYLPALSSLDSIASIHSQTLNHWTESGVIGLSKVMTLKGKTMRKAKVQCLWDFLSYYQRVNTPAIIWRVEYAFK